MLPIHEVESFLKYTVITSYSIHYTKLYEVTSTPALLRKSSGVTASTSSNVITSYSIHYTKLYELFLLRFDEEAAAGLMTPRYLAVRAGITVGQALAFVRKGAQEVETVYYIYILDELQRLLGIVSLRDLLTANDNVKINDIMETNYVSVHEDTDQEEVAKTLETYDLIAVPVVDSRNQLLGIVTFDDIRITSYNVCYTKLLRTLDSVIRVSTS